MSPLIEIDGLSKRYGDKLALDDVSFTVRSGVVTGFLGPNGAGKSTAMRLILGLDRPTAGAARVNGTDYRDFAAPLHEVGAMLEARAVHPGRTAHSHLLSLAQTHGIDRGRVDELLERVGLTDVARKRVGSFSLGMGQRLGIAAALLGDPHTLILDEPANGLDPEGIRWIRRLMRGLAAEGRTVFVSSHVMSEMALTADRLIVIGRGRLIADTTIEEFTRSASSDAVRVRSPRARDLAAVLAAEGATVSFDRCRRARGLRPRGRADRRAGRRGRARAARADTPPGIARGGVHAHDRRGGRVPRLRVSRGGGGMSTEAIHPVTAAPVRVPRVTQARVIRSEATKLASLRSTRWSMLLAVVAMAGLGILISAVRMANWGSADRRPLDPLDVSLAGWHLAQLAVGVLGVLVISGEYSTGLIRSTIGAVPRRLPVLWAKMLVFGTATLVLMIPCAFIAFFVSQSILSRHDVQTSISQPHVLRAVIGAALFLAVTGLLGLALGALLRNTAGAIATFAGVMFVLPGISAILPSSWGNAIDPYLPLNAGTGLMSLQQGANALAPWTGFAVYVGYVAVLTAAAAVLLVRRDA